MKYEKLTFSGFQRCHSIDKHYLQPYVKFELLSKIFNGFFFHIQHQISFIENVFMSNKNPGNFVGGRYLNTQTDLVPNNWKILRFAISRNLFLILYLDCSGRS